LSFLLRILGVHAVPVLRRYITVNLINSGDILRETVEIFKFNDEKNISKALRVRMMTIISLEMGRSFD